MMFSVILYVHVIAKETPFDSEYKLDFYFLSVSSRITVTGKSGDLLLSCFLLSFDVS